MTTPHGDGSGGAAPAAYLTIHKTASFKLHNPSRRKREIIEHAFFEYTVAYQKLLEWASANRDQLEQKIVTIIDGNRRRWASDREIAGWLREAGVTPDVHGSLAEALRFDVAGNLLSYYKLRDDYEQSLEEYEQKKAQALQSDKPFTRKPPTPPTFPVARDPAPAAFEDALDLLRCTGDVDEEDWLYRQSQVIRLQRGRYMPMYFSRPDAVPNNRNFSLLVDPERGTYYALLFLLPDGHRLGQRITPTGNLKRVGRPATAGDDYEPPGFTQRPRCAVLCPLEMGRWHVGEFLTNPSANVRSAFLIERRGEYFLNVAFEFTVPKLEPRTVIGVDRGIAQFIAVRVVDLDGAILAEELWSGDEFLELQWDIKKELRRRQKRGQDITGQTRIRRISDRTVHQLANRIVELAEKYQAQVVIENLTRLDRQKEKFVQLRATPYQKIAAALDYKLPLRGWPAPARVSPAFTSRMCPHCLYGDRGNRPDQETFVCQKCGHTDHADLNAATNIALRWLARQQGRDWWPKNVEKRSHAPE